jgi:phage RecT family recombinase
MASSNRAAAVPRPAPPVTRSIEEQQAENAQAEAISAEVEGRLRKFGHWFEAVLPEHVPAQGFVTLLYGVLRKDKNLARAAAANFPSFMIAATDCAQLGGIPGKTYHFLTFNNTDTGIPDISGTADYKLEIQLAMQSGLVDTVNVECVYEGDDFAWAPTRMRVPEHEIRNFTRLNKDLKAVYAYAEYRGQRVGKCVVMWRAEVMLHRKKAPSKKFWDGDWEYYMWMKTAVHVGRRYWPQSAAYQTAVMAAQSRALAMGGQMMQIRPDEPEQLVPPGMTAIAGEPAGEVLRGVTAENEDASFWAGAQPRAGNGDATAGDGEAVTGTVLPPGTTVPAGAEQAAADVAAPQAAANGHNWADAPLDETVSPSTGSKLSAWWKRASLTGDANRERRRILVCLVAAGPGKPPLRITSPGQLLERQARTAILTLEGIAKAADEAGESLAVRLGRLHDEYAAAIARETEARAEAEAEAAAAAGG